MEQRISMLTLIVPDVSETRRFFEDGLGWQLNAAPSPDVAFYQVFGSVFALYRRGALEEEIGRDVTADPTGAMTIAWNTRTEAEVDENYRKAVAAGAASVMEPKKAFWGGYSSYVEIPGGHLLEIAYNPFWTVSGDGSIALPPPQ